MTWFLKEPRKYSSREEIFNDSENFFFGLQVKLDKQAEESGLKIVWIYYWGKKENQYNYLNVCKRHKNGCDEGNRKKVAQGRNQTEILSLPPRSIPTPAHGYIKIVFYIEEEKLLKRSRGNG